MLTSLSRLSRWTITLTLAFATLDVACSLQAAGETSLKRPNVLILITDEHNFRTLGCYRQLMSEEQAQMWGPDTVVETPHIDRLARQGTMFTQFYACSVCAPTRASLMTGLLAEPRCDDNGSLPTQHRSPNQQ